MRILRSVRAAAVIALIALPTTAGHASPTRMSSSSTSPGSTSLRISVRAGAGAAPRVTSLRCNPPAGTVSRPAKACQRLIAAGRAIFAPTPLGVACTMIYGGPQEAIVSGTLRGVNVWARFRRRDGCEIARWNRVAFLLGAAAA